MPRVLYRELRFRIIDQCLRDCHSSHNIHTLTNACNRVLSESYGVSVSKRTIQYDLSILRNAPYSIDLNPLLLHQGIYRYADTNCYVPFINDDRCNNLSGIFNHASTSPQFITCTLKVSANVLDDFEHLIVSLGQNVEIVSPDTLRRHICHTLRSILEHYDR